MNVNRIKNLAGIEVSKEIQEENVMLNEFSVIPGNASLEDVMAMLDAAKRGLGIANKLSNPADKKKHVRAVFVNLNKIRGALSHYIEK